MHAGSSQGGAGEDSRLHRWLAQAVRVEWGGRGAGGLSGRGAGQQEEEKGWIKELVSGR